MAGGIGGSRAIDELDQHWGERKGDREDMESPVAPTSRAAYSRRAVLGLAGKGVAAAAVGSLFGAGALTPSRARAASTATILYTGLGFTCEAAGFVALARGYFRDEGLDATLVGYSGTDSYALAMQGKADAFHQPAFFLAPALLPPGIDLDDIVATAGMERGCNSLIVAADSPYRTLADLKGQKVSAAPPWRFVYGEPMAQAGLNPHTDVDWQPQVPFPQIGAALANKSVAASAAIEPFSGNLVASGAARALVVQDMPPMMMDYCCSVVMPSALVRADRSKAAAITRALMRGSAWAAKHPVRTAHLEVARGYVQATFQVNRTAIRSIAFAPSVSAAVANTRSVFERMVKLGFLPPTTDVSSLLHQIFVPVTDAD